MDPNLATYIQSARQHGLPDQDIKKNLLQVGWQQDAVDSAFAELSKPAQAPAVAAQPTAPAKPAPVQPVQAAPSAATQEKSAETLNTQQNTNPAAAASAPAVKINNPFAANIAVAATPTAVPQESGKHHWLRWSLIIVIVIAVLGAGGYFAYAYVYNNPTRVWGNFLSGSKSKIYNTNFQLSYTDNTKASSSSTAASLFNLSNIKLSFNGTIYVDGSNASNPKSSADVQYSFGSGNTSFNTGLQYRLLNNVFYVNVGDNPFLSAISNSSNSSGNKISWVKLDFNEAQAQLTSSSSPNSMQAYKEFLDPSLRDQLAQLWDTGKFVKVDHFIGRETVSGKTTLHYANTIDKTALKSMLGQYISKLASVGDTDASQAAKNAQTAQTVVNDIIDKTQVKDFETWIGATDLQLYRVKLVTSAPSIISAMNSSNSVLTSTTNGDDAKRVADMRQMASALELYYNDNGGYPAADSGKPVGITPNYIGIIPAAPAASGSCANFYNTYWYAPAGPKVVNGKTVYSSYEYTFCLGSTVSGYKAGVAKLTPAGIQDNIPCPVSDNTKCVNSNAPTSLSEDDQIKQAVNKIDFNAEFQIDATYSDYGKTQDVQAPADSYDLMKQISDAQSQSRDAKRIADVRQFASALELYFNDKNRYPDKLSDLTPMYIGIIPIAPTPADGNCTASDNVYAYTNKNNGSDYQLSFCLGSDTGQYKAGKNSLSSQSGPFSYPNTQPYSVPAQQLQMNTTQEPAAQKPATAMPVKISLKPNTPVLGNVNAKVTVVEFADYQCPFCEQWYKTVMPDIKSKYIDTNKIKFVYQDFAFLGPDSTTLAEGSHCAADQNLFWQYHDYVFSNQGQENSGWGTADKVKAMAQNISGLNTSLFNKCLDDGTYAQEVQDETNAGKSYGVSGTPTIFVNGVALVGAQSAATFEQAIDKALTK